MVLLSSEKCYWKETQRVKLFYFMGQKEHVIVIFSKYWQYLFNPTVFTLLLKKSFIYIH